MMIAFAGPSLLPEDRTRFRGVEWRPPAQAGDLLRLDARSGLTICLIDGYFDHRPAVRHNEILYLLSSGVRIFGAASIGALRAAEMDRFGLVGAGAIYRAYKRNLLVGDDEVALIHAGPEWDWRALSVPLVDVRATLCAAVRDRMASLFEAKAMLRIAAEIHYVDRDWPALLDRAQGGPPGFGTWLPTGAVQRKRLDAIACLEAAIDAQSWPADPPPFVRTAFFEALLREVGADIVPAMS